MGNKLEIRGKCRKETMAIISNSKKRADINIVNKVVGRME